MRHDKGGMQENNDVKGGKVLKAGGKEKELPCWGLSFADAREGIKTVLCGR